MVSESNCIENAVGLVVGCGPSVNTRSLGGVRPLEQNLMGGMVRNLEQVLTLMLVSSTADTCAGSTKHLNGVRWLALDASLCRRCVWVIAIECLHKSLLETKAD